jgi:hypothetical protein
MKLYTEDTVAFPREDVYQAQRDDMVKLAAYLPNIERIEVLKREEVEGGVKLLNLWKAAAGEVPAVIRPFVKPEMMQWKDDARWYNDRFSCDWRLELGFFTEQVDIRGATRFEALGADRCKVIIDGELKVDANNLPGVPRLLAGKIVGEVEKFVVKMITPNLTSVNRGLERYLAARKG